MRQNSLAVILPSKISNQYSNRIKVFFKQTLLKYTKSGGILTNIMAAKLI